MFYAGYDDRHRCTMYSMWQLLMAAIQSSVESRYSGVCSVS